MFQRYPAVCDRGLWLERKGKCEDQVMMVFATLAHGEHEPCKLYSRNGNQFKSIRTLCESLGTELKRSVILYGETVCLDGDGKSLFAAL